MIELLVDEQWRRRGARERARRDGEHYPGGIFLIFYLPTYNHTYLPTPAFTYLPTSTKVHVHVHKPAVQRVRGTTLLFAARSACNSLQRTTPGVPADFTYRQGPGGVRPANPLKMGGALARRPQTPSRRQRRQAPVLSCQRG